MHQACRHVPEMLVPPSGIIRQEVHTAVRLQPCARTGTPTGPLPKPHGIAGTHQGTNKHACITTWRH